MTMVGHKIAAFMQFAVIKTKADKPNTYHSNYSANNIIYNKEC